MNPSLDTDPDTGAILIPLRSRKYPGLVAKVDEEDLDIILPYKWSPLITRRSIKSAYAHTYSKGLGHRYMHRLILGLPKWQHEVDHINGDGLDNRRCNLRLVTRSQNNRNSRKRPGTTSRFKGVHRHSDGSGWVVQIHSDGTTKYVGFFADEEEAARVYDKVAREEFGEFAALNFPDERTYDAINGETA